MLSDPDRRHAYDALGPESLKAKWAVGTHYKTSEEVWALSCPFAPLADADLVQLRQHYSRLAHEKAAASAESLVRSSGKMQVDLDARLMMVPWALPPRLDPLDPEELVGASFVERLRRFHMVGISQLMMRHGFSASTFAT